MWEFRSDFTCSFYDLDLIRAYDMGRDLAQTLAMTAGVGFDLDADGLPTSSAGWPAPTACWHATSMAMVRVCSGLELFGNATRLPDGHKATNGFKALAALDENRDRHIDALDAACAQLLVW